MMSYNTISWVDDIKLLFLGTVPVCHHVQNSSVMDPNAENTHNLKSVTCTVNIRMFPTGYATNTVLLTVQQYMLVRYVRQC
jgi:hypothetical protein